MLCTVAFHSCTWETTCTIIQKPYPWKLHTMVHHTLPLDKSLNNEYDKEICYVPWHFIAVHGKPLVQSYKSLTLGDSTPWSIIKLKLLYGDNKDDSLDLSCLSAQNQDKVTDIEPRCSSIIK